MAQAIDKITELFDKIRAIREVLFLLTPREQDIILMRFGLRDGRTYTLEQVGQEFGVTRERIRQIEAKALSKIRNYYESREPIFKKHYR